MKTFPFLTRSLPVALGILASGCNPQDGQMQARLADAEARAKHAEAAVAELRRKVAEAPAPSPGAGPELDEFRRKYAALEEANQQLQAMVDKSRAAPENPMAHLDPQAIEASFVNGFLGKKQEWKEALADYQVKGYEQPEVTVEDVKPFRTTIGIKLEQAGRAFTAQVPVTADFQGNWTFPGGEEVVGLARQAAAGIGPAASAPASPPAAVASAPPPAAAPRPAETPPAAPKQEGPEPVPFGGKNLIKLPPIKFPGDP